MKVRERKKLPSPLQYRKAAVVSHGQEHVFKFEGGVQEFERRPTEETLQRMKGPQDFRTLKEHCYQRKGKQA